MRKLRWQENFTIPVIAILVIASVLFIPPPTRAVTPPVVNYTNANTIGGGASMTLLIRVVAGDVIIMNSGVGVTGNAGITNLNVSTVTDNNTDVFVFDNRQHAQTGGNCNTFCGDSEIWSALSKVTGHANIAVTWTSSGTGNSPSLELMDVSNIAVAPDKTANGACNTGGAGCGLLTTGNTSTSNSFDPTDSLEVASFSAAFTWDHFVPGANYVTLVQLVNGVGGAEYSTSAASPTNYPFSISVGGASVYSEAAAQWGNPTLVTTIVVVPCTAFQLQCWWFPFYFFGIYMVLIAGMAFMAKVPGRDMLGLIMEAFSLASLLAVMLGILNVMFPLIITIVQVVRAIRE